MAGFLPPDLDHRGQLRGWTVFSERISPVATAVAFGGDSQRGSATRLRYPVAAMLKSRCRMSSLRSR